MHIDLDHCLTHDKCSKILGIMTIMSEPWDPKICQYKVSSITNVLVVYVRNYHKLNDLKHQFIIIIAHDFVGQEFRQGSIGNAPHCSPMAGSPLGNRLLKTGGAPFSLQPLRGWFGLPHISAASKFWDLLSEGSEL